ncbi:MAG: hypothetical protein E7354_01040 [Clostridiales bacterium]|nr:hypothetical protein [Clostridiales bacterium]
METHKCPNCGASLGAESESYSTTCPYCNSTLINKAQQKQVESQPQEPNVPFFNTYSSNTTPNEYEIDKSRFNGFLFVILLIFFWPLAIFYLLTRIKKK